MTAPTAAGREWAADAGRAYAVTMLRGLAPTQQGCPIAQVQKLVKDALTPLGICRAPPGCRHLAADLAVGRPVALP